MEPVLARWPCLQDTMHGRDAKCLGLRAPCHQNHLARYECSGTYIETQIVSRWNINILDILGWYIRALKDVSGDLVDSLARPHTVGGGEARLLSIVYSTQRM